MKFLKGVLFAAALTIAAVAVVDHKDDIKKACEKEKKKIENCKKAKETI